MALDPVTAVFEIGGKLIDHFFPNAAEADAAKLKLIELQQSGELAAMSGQLEINKIEAASASLFVAGWRPFVGWMCGISLGLVYIPKAVILSGMWAYQAWSAVHGGSQVLPVFPDLGVTDLFGLLGAMLGMGGLRTFEKLKEVDTTSVRKLEK